MVEDGRVLTAEMTAALRCPVCHHPLAGQIGLKCPRGHSFDVARQGYVHLGTGGRMPSGDTAEMVMAREEVQSAGLFAPLEEALIQTLTRAAPAARLIADLGAGPGRYLARILDERPEAQGLAFDVSKAALRRAARAHPRMGAVLADAWARLPLADGSIDAIVNVFAPRNGREMRRILRPGGVLIVVTPTPVHLGELREAAGLLDVDPAKQERLSATLAGFTPAGDQTVRWRLDLMADQARKIIMMGPNAFHGHDRAVPIVTHAEVTISTWTGRPLPSRRADRGAAR
ncbi:MAG TPA: methyltransferase domain-containing protein [Candidatus Limnocylindrales bacterium]|nr:methyltransferase domain-containing protein [Candidatus Limnocylindrales bacterium]